MTFRSEALQATGQEAQDQHGVKLGTVTDVLFDGDGAPRWAVVDPGLLHRAHYAPLEGAYQTDDGNVVLPIESSTLKRAPVATRDHVLTPDVEARLHEHYG
jgi:PRC-barrel domain